MKKLLPIIFFFASSIGLRAQSGIYHPFPTDSAMWREQYGSVICNCCDDYQLVLNGDTIVGSTTYHKIEYQGIKHSIPNTAAGVSGYYWGCGGSVYFNYLSHYAHVSYLGALREDSITKKIYFLEPGTSHDTLLYDFSLSVGDTLPITYKNDDIGPYPTNVISSIDSALVNGSYHKRFNISEAYLGTDPNYVSIIEGVGSTFGLFPHLIPIFEEGGILECFSLKDSLAYPWGGAGSCVPLVVIAGVNEIKESENRVALFPNPATDRVKIISKNRLYSIEIMDIFGKKIYHSEKNNIQTEINISNFTNGIYFVHMMDVNKNVIVKKIVKQ
jgi:Secretion system C-terminal sorting domain